MRTVLVSLFIWFIPMLIHVVLGFPHHFFFLLCCKYDISVHREREKIAHVTSALYKFLVLLKEWCMSITLPYHQPHVCIIHTRILVTVMMVFMVDFFVCRTALCDQELCVRIPFFICSIYKSSRTGTNVCDIDMDSLITVIVFLCIVICIDLVWC